jgi:hypothetical protein
MNRHRIIHVMFATSAVLGAIAATSRGRNLIWSAYTRIRGRYTVAERLEQYGQPARRKLRPAFDLAGVDYPPRTVGLLVFKRSTRMEVYAGADEDHLKFICAYPIEGLSGKLGPKLRDGDRQVPEGRYEIESLNPNSRFHLALRLNYPNDFDKAMGRKDGREKLGSGIMIHGGNASIGCLAMGDAVAEELFVLVADTGAANTFVVIAPVDLRIKPEWTAPSDLPEWVDSLYSRLRIAIREFPQ